MSWKRWFWLVSEKTPYLEMDRRDFRIGRIIKRTKHSQVTLSV